MGKLAYHTKLNSYLHIPTGLRFYNFDICNLIGHTVFSKCVPDWFESAFIKLSLEEAESDDGFIKATNDWKREGLHRLVRQCSMLSDWPLEYVAEDSVIVYMAEQLEYFGRCSEKEVI